MGVSEYGHYTAQAEESVLNSGATKTHFSFYGGKGLVTSMLLWLHHNHYHNVYVFTAHQPCEISTLQT